MKRLSVACLIVMASLLRAQAVNAQTSFEGAKLEGCSQSWDRSALMRALEIEAENVNDGDRALRARFSCPDGLTADLSVHDGQGTQLAQARVQLADLPSTVRVRMLALVWAELLRASLTVSETAANSSAEPALDTKQAASAEALAPPSAREGAPRDPVLATSTPRPTEPVALRSALFSGRPRGARLFEVQAGFAPRYFTSSPTVLLGFDAGFRIGAFSIISTYGVARTQGSLGEVRTRLAGARLDVALACFGERSVQACGLTELGLAQSRMTGIADTGADDSGFDAAVSTAALAIATRFSQRWFGVELVTRAGAARGPTAREDGRTLDSLSGLFLALTLSMVVQP